MKYNEERLIFLILGDACNLNCKYCIEHDAPVKNYSINEKIYDFIKSVKNDYRLKAVTFYGGEPTLYFDKMKTIVTALEGNDIHFSTMTNGKLINKEMVEFFNKYAMSVNVSWDGYGSSISRGFDVVKENPNILDIEFLWLTAVVNKYSSMKQIIAAANEVNETYMKKHEHPFNLHINTPLKTFESDVYDVDADLLEKEQRWLLDKTDCTPIERFLKEYVMRQGTMQYNTGAPLLRKCGVGGSMIVMDTEGNIYDCKNRRCKVGTIDTSPERITLRIISHDECLDMSEDCRKCDVFNLCMGGCRYIKDKEHFCKLQKACFRPIIEKVKEKEY